MVEKIDKEDSEILAKASKEKEILDMVEKGKITIINFFATWCPPCKMLGEELKKIKDKDIVIVRVDVDRDNVLSDRLGINAVPFVAIFDKKGKAFTAFCGYRDENDLKKIIESARKIK
jgi:thioredoxin 1